MYLRYGISLSDNPMYYKMPIEYTAFESANQIKLVLVGLNTRDDVTSKYEIIINLDGTIIEGNSNVKLTLLSLEPDLSQYALKSEIPDVFETNGLTELETGESSANIEAALGIDFASLIEIIRENKAVIVDRNSTGDYKACIHATGNISSGNGAANLMFFIGTTPTIYQIQYVGGAFALAVTKYEFAEKDEIPDVSNLATKSEVNAKQDALVSGTNIKTLNGMSLLGEGDIQLDKDPIDYETLTNKPSINNVELSGNLSFEDLGLNVNPTWEQIQNKPTFATVATSGDYNDLTDTPDLTIYQPITDNSLATSAKTIPAAINEIKESVDSISDPYEINLTNLLSAEDSESISTAIGGIDNLNATVQDNRIIVGTISNGSVSVSIRILGNVTTLYYLLDSVVGLTLNEIAITNTSGTLSKSVTTHSVLTENMVINALDSDETTLPLSAAQGKSLNDAKQSKEDASLATTAKTVVGAIAELKTAVDSKASSDAVNSKQNATDQSLQTTDKTIVGAINEILPKATGVGKVDARSNGTGEVFNRYVDAFVNVASGSYSHAEGSNTKATGNYSHAEGANTTASGDFSHAEGSNTKATGNYSHAEGENTRASSRHSHAEGGNTNATSSYEHAEGSYNVSNTGDTENLQTRHSVGIGTSSSDRKNAHEIMANGDHYIYGIGGYDGTNAVEDTSKTLQTVINEIVGNQPVYTTVPSLTAAYTIPANATMVEKIYMITIGATVYDVTGDASIKWAGGVTPTVSANSILVVSVLNNLATWQTFI